MKVLLLKYKFNGKTISKKISEKAASFPSTNNHSGKAKATKLPPLGRPDFPPPAEITTYCRPFTM